MVAEEEVLRVAADEGEGMDVGRIEASPGDLPVPGQRVDDQDRSDAHDRERGGDREQPARRRAPARRRPPLLWCSPSLDHASERLSAVVALAVPGLAGLADEEDRDHEGGARWDPDPGLRNARADSLGPTEADYQLPETVIVKRW